MNAGTGVAIGLSMPSQSNTVKRRMVETLGSWTGWLLAAVAARLVKNKLKK